jgi:DNA topoisomerase III
MQTEDGKWRVEFDEPWAREGTKPPEGEDEAAQQRDRAGDGAAQAA